jgi:hypothetical protein
MTIPVASKGKEPRGYAGWSREEPSIQGNGRCKGPEGEGMASVVEEMCLG